jgi:divalent metal cation (Fe/Co/Zn/Cd) transporter
MPVLAIAKRRTGEAMASAVLIADSAETMLCSLILLVGLLLNATVGWWWADPVAALGIAFLAFKEGIETRQGDSHEGRG